MGELGFTDYKCHNCQKEILTIRDGHPFHGARVCADCYKRLLELFQKMRDGNDGKLDIYR